MKKIITLIIAVLAICTSSIFAASHIKYEMSDGLPEGWTYIASQDGNSYIDTREYKGESCILIAADTSGLSNTATTNIELLTDGFEFTGKQIFSFRMAINNVSGYFKRIYLFDGTNRKEMLVIQDGKLKVGGVAVTLPTDEFFDLCIAVDTENSYANVWLNTECVISDVQIDISDYINKEVKLLFWNGFRLKNIASLWYVSEIERYENAEYNPVSVPEYESSFVDVTTLNEIQVDFGTLIPELQSKNIMLEVSDIDNDNSEYVSTVIGGDKQILYVEPENGFNVLKNYRLTVSNIKDIFNVEHNDYVMSFTTAPVGYSAPRCTIDFEYDTSNIIEDEMINISAQIQQGSENIVKAELYRNSKHIGTYTENFKFRINAMCGVNEIYVKLYDELGGVVKSNVISFSAKMNTAPAIHHNLFDGIKLEHGDKIEFSADDIEGTVERMILRFDGNKIVDTRSAHFDWTVPQTAAIGSHSIEIVAIDNLGARKTDKIAVDVTKYEISEKITSDYSSFSDNLTTTVKEVSPGITACPNATQTSNHYIKNGAIDDSHQDCIIIGADGKTGGSTAWLGISGFTEANRPANIVIFETDLYISSQHTLANIFVKENTENKVCPILQFYKDIIQYFNASENLTLPLETKKWYDIRVEINLTDSTYTLVLNGEKIAENYALSTTVKSLANIRIEFYNYDEEAAYIANSKFNISDKMEFPTVSDVEFMKDGLHTDSSNADTLVLKMKEKFDSQKIVISEIKLMAMNTKVDFSEYKIADNEEGNTINVSLKYPLEANCNYQVIVYYKINENKYNTSYSFETSLNGTGVSNSDFVVEDNTIKFTADIVSSEDKTATVIIVKYKNDIMQEVQYREISLATGLNSAIETPVISYEDDENVSYKAYIWNGWQNRTALSNRIYYISNSLSEL